MSPRRPAQVHVIELVGGPWDGQRVTVRGEPPAEWHVPKRSGWLVRPDDGKLAEPVHPSTRYDRRSGPPDVEKGEPVYRYDVAVAVS